MKIVFFGTPEYVLPILDSLSKEHEITAVVTQPPKPAGRKQFKVYSPVDTWAHKRKIPIYFESAKIIEKKTDAQMGILASYGEFIPNNVINYFKYGILNVHPSLLPKWRGASPIQSAITSGDIETGVTIIKLDQEMDHGQIISSFKEEILPDDTSETLRIRLFEKSSDFLVNLIPNYLNGKISLKPQDHSKATFTKTVKKSDAFISPKHLSSALQGGTFKGGWEIPFIKNFSLEPNPFNLEKFIRAMHPWPGAWTEIKIQRDQDIKISRLKILKAHIESTNAGTQKLVLDLVQLEGKNPVSWEQFQTGHKDVKFA